MHPPRLKSGRNPVTATRATSSLHSSFQANCRENDELTAVNEEFKFHFLLLQALRQETTTVVLLYPQGIGSRTSQGDQNPWTFKSLI